MPESYAVVWSEGDGPVAVGRLELRPGSFVLAGAREGEGRSVDAVDISRIRIGDGPERLNGLKTVVVERHSGPPVLIGAVNGLGQVFEIAEALTANSRLEGAIVRIPIRRDRADEARALVRRGPPFPPGDVPGLSRHDVFTGEGEVLFVFHGHDIRRAVQELARRPAVWSAAMEWRRCMAGRPTLLEPDYSWSHEHGLERPEVQSSDLPPGLRRV
jgi:hypothetical protein